MTFGFDIDGILKGKHTYIFQILTDLIRKNLDNRIVIISGRSDSQIEMIKEDLKEKRIFYHYISLYPGQHRGNEDVGVFKARRCKELLVDLFFEDNYIQAAIMRTSGITVAEVR